MFIKKYVKKQPDFYNLSVSLYSKRKTYMYTIEKFKELFAKQFEANHIGDTNTFLDVALVTPDLYVCFENVYKAINNVKDVTDPVTKAKFNKVEIIL